MSTLHTGKTFTAEELDLLHDQREVKTLTHEEAKAQLMVWIKLKAWRSLRYLALDRHCQDLACRKWVREDVFGHTFTGSAQ